MEPSIEDIGPDYEADTPNSSFFCSPQPPPADTPSNNSQNEPHLGSINEEANKHTSSNPNSSSNNSTTTPSSSPPLNRAQKRLIKRKLDKQAAQQKAAARNSNVNHIDNRDLTRAQKRKIRQRKLLNANIKRPPKGPADTCLHKVDLCDPRASFINAQRVKEVFNSFQNGKSPGLDQVTPQMLKNLGPDTIERIVRLYKARPYTYIYGPKQSRRVRTLQKNLSKTTTSAKIPQWIYFFAK